jgi:glyoxylase-like metal-dependent hydrolase (beta-lactamase superfamily II)
MTIVAEDNIIRIDKFELGPFGTNAYTVTCRASGYSALIDAPAEANIIKDKLKNTIPQYILLTHNHMDHTGALTQLRAELKVPLAAHASDATNLTPLPEILLSNGDTVSLGEIKFKVLHTPGHTPGSLCFLVSHYLISGDTIFPGGPGRTSTPDDFKQIINSINEKIFVLPDDTQIYPGHGNSTVLKNEKKEFDIFTSRPHESNLCGEVLWIST